MLKQRAAIAAAVVLLAGATAAPALAQPFESGPPGTVVGSSMSGARIGGAPAVGGRRIQGADVFGDTVEERAWGRDYDDSHLRPTVRRPEPDEVPTELRAREGQPALDPLNAGAFARSGPGAIAGSAVTRPSLGGRRTGGRAIIRRDK